MITNLAKTIIQIISILLFRNYILYLAIGTVVTISNNIIASRLAQKEYPYIIEKNDISTEEKKDIFKNISSVFTYKVSSVLLNATDNLLISTIVGTTFVGMYSNYLVLQIKITTLFSLVFTSLTASIGNLIVTENKNKRVEIFQCEQSISFIFSGIVIPCYILLADDFIKVWLGENLMLGFTTTCVIGLNMYLGCVLQPLWSYREATGLYRKTKWIMMICAVENIVLSIVLGIKIGLIGIILASAISRITTYVWYEPMVLFKEYFGISTRKYYIKMLLNTLLIILMVAVLTVFLSRFEVNGWLQWIIKAFVTGLVGTIVMILIYHKSKGYIIFKNKILSFIKRKKT